MVLVACARVPAAIDPAALVKAEGAEEARRDLLARILAHPRDVAPRLALAELDEKDRPSAAIAQLEVVETLGGPLGVKWRASDRERLGRLLLARGHARLERASPTALADLQRARKLGAAPAELDAALAPIALGFARLRHVDPGVRAEGRKLIAPLWAGARPNAAPADRGELGARLWETGAKREAYEQLAAWHASGRDDPELARVYASALAWWIPPESPRAPPAEPVDEPAPPKVDHVAGDARAVAIARYSRAPIEIAQAFARDPAIADRLGRDFVDRSIDAAAAHAQLGAAFDTLGDPARARAQWQAALDASDEPAFARGLAEACARGGDGDAALVFATGAAAAWGDPATVWARVARLLERAGKHVEALTASRSAIELADREVLPRALDVAIAASAALGRADQVVQLRARRDRFPPAPADTAAALAEPRADRLFIVSRAHPRDVPLRAALVRAAPTTDPRHWIAIDELVALAADGELDAIAALPLPTSLH